jgi:hypothetical protein
LVLLVEFVLLVNLMAKVTTAQRKNTNAWNAYNQILDHEEHEEKLT